MADSDRFPYPFRMPASRNRLYHRLQSAAHRLKKAADREVAGAAAITTAQASVLSIVAETRGATQKDVALQLGLNESAVTAMANRLVDAGYLERSRSTRDARAWELMLTSAGEAALEDVRAPFRRINAAIESVMSEAEIDAMADALDRLIDRFDPR